MFQDCRMVLESNEFQDTIAVNQINKYNCSGPPTFESQRQGRIISVTKENCITISMQKHQLNSWLYFGDTANCKVRTLEHLCPFLTMATKKHQSLLCSRDIADIKMVQTDWLRAFWLSSHEPDFSQIWDLRRKHSKWYKPSFQNKFK